MARRRAPAITAEERERLQREARELARARSVAAAAERQKSGSMQRVNVGYVASIIQTARSEARRAAAAAREAAAGRRRQDVGADLAALAKQLGVQGARPGESMADFKARVMSAAEAAMGGSRG